MFGVRLGVPANADDTILFFLVGSKQCGQEEEEQQVEEEEEASRRDGATATVSLPVLWHIMLSLAWP
jgi:hypothetical protein